MNDHLYLPAALILGNVSRLPTEHGDRMNFRGNMISAIPPLKINLFLDVSLTVHLRKYVEINGQLDATDCFFYCRTYFNISPCIFNSIIDKPQNMHFLLNTILV